MRLPALVLAFTFLASGCLDGSVMEDSSDASEFAPSCDPSAVSPASWPPEELDALPRSPGAEISAEPSVATSNRGVVVGTTGPIAIRAGLKALENCGSAMDAVVATAMAQIALAAGSWVSFAGHSSLLYYDASNATVTAVNANWQVLQDNRETSQAHAVVPTGESVLVHGFMDGAGVAHELWGRLPWATVMEPAIWVAENGVSVDSGFENQMTARYPYILRTPEGRDIFLKEDGTPYRAGDTFRQPELATTLRAVAEHGHRYLYEGPWAERWVELVNREGGHASLDDLSSYHAWVRPPMQAEARGWTLLGPDEPDEAPKALFERLKQVEEANLREIGSPYESPEVLFRELRIWAGGPSFAVDRRGTHSDAVVAVDSEGNVATLTHSINTVLWGSNGIFVDGVSISDAEWVNAGNVEAAGPGGRVASPTTPTLVMDPQGRPVLASSAIGSGLQELTFNRLVDFLEYDQPLGESIHNPSFHLLRAAIQGEYDPVLLMQVRAMGEPIPEVERDAMATKGFIVAAQLDHGTGEVVGAFGGNHNGRAEGVA